MVSFDINYMKRLIKAFYPMSWTKAMDKWGPQKLYDHLYNILYVQESLSWNMSLTLSKLDIEVSPFTYALIKAILLCLCGPCCLKNDDRVAVANPTLKLQQN